jgi:hypothetical protein
VDRLPFSYGEFYDFPRMIRFCFEGNWYFLRSEFDDAKDDYDDSYKTYRLPYRTEEEILSHPNYWMDLSNADYLGRITVTELGFDETRRKSIGAHLFKDWIYSRVSNESAASRP